MILVPIALAYLIYVWLHTGAFVDFFGWLLKTRNVFYIGDFLNQTGSGSAFKGFPYPLWLELEHNNFFTKLISCPLCLSFWLNLVIGLSLGLGLFFVLVCAYFTLLAYLVLKKLYEQSI